MKPCTIGILDFTGTFVRSKKRAFNPVKILKDKAIELGHKVRVYRVERCQLFFENHQTTIFEKNKPVQFCDVLIPRVDILSRLDIELLLVKQFQEAGIPVVNEYMSILNAKNKLRTTQILSEHHIAVPKTAVVRKFEYLDQAVEEVGGYPVVLKSAFGSYGVGVMIIESARSLYSALDLILERMDSNIILIQEFIAEADGKDYRAFVVDGKVIASMQRHAKEGDFRANLELGGTASKGDLTLEEKKLAIKAAKALNLEVAGVDILRTKQGPVVIEINANPGFKGLTKASGIDIAKAIIQYAARKVGERL